MFPDLDDAARLHTTIWPVTPAVKSIDLAVIGLAVQRSASPT
jgi:hypothetical protein